MLKTGRMHIEWTLSAQKDLKKIFNFYCKTANSKIAHKIKNEIISSPSVLKNGTSIGQIENLIAHKNQGHRYLVIHHCKIIYRIENDTFFITHVFDTRQHPKKLK